MRLASDLTQFGMHAEAVGEPMLAAEAAARLDHLAGGDFTVMIIGQPGVGRSTLVNALLGARLLPTAAAGEADASAREATAALTGSGDRSAARTFVRVDAPDGEILYGHCGKWIGASAQLVVAPLELRDGGLSVSAAAALDCVDAVVLVIDAQAPPSQEQWEALGKTFARVPRDRMRVVANKLDLVGEGDRSQLLVEPSARVAEAFAGAPALLGISARDGIRGKLQFDPARLAASGLETLETALANRLAPPSDAARAAIGNDAIERLSARLSDALRARRSALDAGSDMLTERLLRLQADLDEAVAQVHGWLADIEHRNLEVRSTVAKMKRRLGDQMAERVAPLVTGANFTWRYIEERSYRDRELLKACDPKLFTAFRERATEIREEINDTLTTFLTDLGQLQAAWDVARSARLNDDAEAPGPSGALRWSKEMAEAIEPLLQAIVDTASGFEVKFRQRCTVVSFRAFLLRSLRLIGHDVPDASPKFQQECVRKLQSAARQAVDEAGMELACEAVADAALQMMWGYARSLSESIHGELHERKLSLRQQYENAQADQAREHRQLEAAALFFEELKQRVAERRSLLAELQTMAA